MIRSYLSPVIFPLRLSVTRCSIMRHKPLIFLGCQPLVAAGQGRRNKREKIPPE